MLRQLFESVKGIFWEFFVQATFYLRKSHVIVKCPIIGYIAFYQIMSRGSLGYIQFDPVQCGAIQGHIGFYVDL